MESFRNHFILAVAVLVITAVVVHAPAALAQDGRTVMRTADQNSQLLSSQQSFTAQADFTMKPSVISSSLSPYGAGEQKLDLVTYCLLTTFGIIVPDCDITIDWFAQSGTGGHVHNTNRPPGKFKTENGETGGSINPGSPGKVTDNSGRDGLLRITYSAPEASGTTRLTVRGKAVFFGIPLTFGPDTYTIGIQFGGLAFASGNGLFVNPQSDMHDNNNGNASSGMRDALQSMAANFAQRLTQQGVPADQVPTITINALSLPQGGLFDFSVEWNTPHRAHRFGRHADVRIRNLTDTQRTVLAKAFRYAGATAPYTPESPRVPKPTHWHIYVR